jgi:dienelactone hydrolase
MARDGVDLAGVASFHGPLATDAPARKGAVKARVMVANGGADTFIPIEQVQAFIAEMREAGVILEFHSYPGALHSFTNPEADELARKFNLHIGYNAQADRLSCQSMQDFFHHVFQQ